MASPHRDPLRGADATPASEGSSEGVLPPASFRQRQLIGRLVVASGIVAVFLVAGGAPVAVRAPAVLVAALLLPGFPLVARLRVDVPTLLALTVCTSLALEAGSSMLLVQLRLWHPQVLGLALAVYGVGGTLAVLSQLAAVETRKPTWTP